MPCPESVYAVLLSVIVWCCLFLFDGICPQFSGGGRYRFFSGFSMQARWLVVSSSGNGIADESLERDM